jgi:hypothetical protein
MKGTTMTAKQDIAFERTHLERLKLAADVILSEPDDIGDALEAELTLFRDRLEHALLECSAGLAKRQELDAEPQP